MNKSEFTNKNENNKVDSHTKDDTIENIALINLAPKFEPDAHKIYLTNLEAAVQQDNIRNIALTGTYGSGKSSILNEFKKKHPKNSITISLPRFTSHSGNTELGNKDEDIENILQKEILKHLIFTTQPNKLPDSKFIRTRTPSILERFSSSILFPLPVIYILHKIGFFNYFASLLDNSVATHKTPILIGVILILMAVFFTFPLKFNNLRLTKFSTQGIELSSSNQEYFDKYLDEIIYFFSKTKCKYLIFEDLDRFDNLEIFEDLRNLNTIINNSVKENVIFIYAIRESLFAEPETGAINDKFFDLIIPISYFLSPAPASFKKLVSDLKFGIAISDEMLDVMKNYINNYRHLVILRNNFVMHKEILKKSGWFNKDEHNENLLGIMLIKTLLPSEFENILLRKSQIDALSYSINQITNYLDTRNGKELTGSYGNPYDSVTSRSWKKITGASNLNKIKSGTTSSSMQTVNNHIDNIIEIKKNNKLISDLIDTGYLSEHYWVYSSVFKTDLRSADSIMFLYYYEDLIDIARFPSNKLDSDYGTLWDESNKFSYFPNHVYNVNILNYIMENQEDMVSVIHERIFPEILLLNSEIDHILFPPDTYMDDPEYTEYTNSEKMSRVLSKFKSSKIGSLLTNLHSSNDIRTLHDFLSHPTVLNKNKSIMYDLVDLYTIFLISSLNLKDGEIEIHINPSSLPALHLIKLIEESGCIGQHFFIRGFKNIFFLIDLDEIQFLGQDRIQNNVFTRNLSEFGFKINNSL